MMFHFDTSDGERRIVDHVGTELSCEAEAMEQAFALLRDLSHAGAHPGTSRELAVRVRRKDGRGLFEARMVLSVDRVL